MNGGARKACLNDVLDHSSVCRMLLLALPDPCAAGMDCIPRTLSRAQTFDSLSSMANIAGYRCARGSCVGAVTGVRNAAAVWLSVCAIIIVRMCIKNQSVHGGKGLCGRGRSIAGLKQPGSVREMVGDGCYLRLSCMQGCD